MYSSPEQGKTDYTHAQPPVSGTKRLPELLMALKTCPGGNRWAGLFDDRVLTFWHELANAADAGNGYTVELNVSGMAERLGVHRHTLQRWLKFFQRNHLLKLTRRAGGRGQGVRVRMTWIKHGDELAERRRKREFEREQRTNANPEPVSVSGETVPQGLKSLKQQPAADGHPHRGDQVRGPAHARYLLWEMRQAVNATALHHQQRETLMAQLGRWVWSKSLSLIQLRRVHGWLTEQAGKSVAFTGRQLVQWLLRGLHGVVQWARSRSNKRATRRTVAQLERSDRAALAVRVEPALYAAQVAEVRAALVADGWGVPATG